MILDRTRRSPDRIALVSFGEGRQTYGELGERIGAAAAVLGAAGVGRGDRVALAAANRPEIVEYLAATLHLGGVLVPLNTRLSPAELRHIVVDSGASVVLADGAVADAIDTVADELGPVWLLRLPDEGLPPAGWRTTDEMAGGEVAPLGRSVPTEPTDTAVLMYTSGTTGDPKGVMISHGNLVAAVQNLMLLIPMGDGSGLLAMAPLFHVGALSLLVGSLATGGSTVILGAFDPAQALAAIDRETVTFTFGVPAMFQLMAADPSFTEVDLSGVLLMCAGAPVPESLLMQYLDRGAKVTQGYGLTESTAVVSLLDPDWATRKLGSAGRPYPLTEVQIRDTRGQVIDQAGVDGEIWVRGRNVVRGYWRRPDETAALRDAEGWLRTGDAGHLDIDGFLYVTDRVKDMLITGGENVYPAEVEKVLAGHPDVTDVAVVGTPDERWGEIVTAVVVPRSGATPDLDNIQAYSRQHLGGYKVPRRLHVVEELPRNASGKVLKRNLRQELT